MIKPLVQMPISRRLPLMALLMVVLAGVAGLALYAWEHGSRLEMLRENTERMAHDQADRVSDWLEVVRTVVVAEASLSATAETIGALQMAIAAQDGGLAAIKPAYTTANSHPLGARQDLADAGDGSAYSAAHSQVHAHFRRTLSLFGFYDIFLFGPGGDLLYTVAKEADFGENFVSGPYAATGLGVAFRGCRGGGAGRDRDRRFRILCPQRRRPGRLCRGTGLRRGEHEGRRLRGAALGRTSRRDPDQRGRPGRAGATSISWPTMARRARRRGLTAGSRCPLPCPSCPSSPT